MRFFFIPLIFLFTSIWAFATPDQNLKWYTAHYKEKTYGYKPKGYTLCTKFVDPLTDKEELKESCYKPRYLDLNYPQFIGTGNKIKKLNSKIRNQVFKYVNERKESQRKYDGYDYYPDYNVKELADSPFESQVDIKIDYKVNFAANGFVSIYLQILDTSFGKRATSAGYMNHDIEVINYDLKSEKELTHEDIFCKKDSLKKLHKELGGEDTEDTEAALLRDFKDYFSISKTNNYYLTYKDWGASVQRIEREKLKNYVCF